MIYGPKSRDTTGYSRNAGSNSMDKFMSRHITILGLQSFPWDSKHKSAVTILVDGTIETVIRNLVFSSTSIAAVLSFKSLGNDCKPRIPHSHLSISWWFSDMVYNLSCPVSGQSLSCVLSESFQRVETLQDITAQQQTTKRETFWRGRACFIRHRGLCLTKVEGRSLGMWTQWVIQRDVWISHSYGHVIWKRKKSPNKSIRKLSIWLWRHNMAAFYPWNKFSFLESKFMCKINIIFK